ncbi:serine/threonine-protein kinase [Kitasatospora aburaviensis]
MGAAAAADRRPLRTAGTPRRRRHGPGLARPRQRAVPGGRAEGGAAAGPGDGRGRPRRRQRAPRTRAARGPGARPAPAPQRRRHPPHRRHARAPAPWLVMELVSGGSLADRIARGPLTVPEAARIGRGVLAALRAAHAAGIQHRDVKPGNVLLRPDGTPVLTDFGIAAMQDATALTATGALIGSPEYIAPERIRGEEGNPSSDLWSLGMMLYVAVEGHPRCAAPPPSRPSRPSWTSRCRRPAVPAGSARSWPPCWPGTPSCGRTPTSSTGRSQPPSRARPRPPRPGRPGRRPSWTPRARAAPHPAPAVPAVPATSGVFGPPPGGLPSGPWPAQGRPTWPARPTRPARPARCTRPARRTRSVRSAPSTRWARPAPPTPAPHPARRGAGVRSPRSPSGSPPWRWPASSSGR